MRLIRNFSISLLAFAMPVAASATDRSVRPDEITRARIIANHYADCLVARHPAIAVEIVVLDLDNRTIRSRFPQAISASCMANARDMRASGLRFGGDSFRYMLAEGLVRLHFGATGPTDFTTLPLLARAPVVDLDPAVVARMSPQRQQQQREQHRAAVQSYAMSMLGECTARLAPDGVRAIAQTVPDSDEETAAIAIVQPAMAQCLPEDFTVRLTRVVVRGELLSSYYRLAHAAGQNATLSAPSS